MQVSRSLQLPVVSNHKRVREKRPVDGTLRLVVTFPVHLNRSIIYLWHLMALLCVSSLLDSCCMSSVAPPKAHIPSQLAATDARKPISLALAPHLTPYRSVFLLLFLVHHLHLCAHNPSRGILLAAAVAAETKEFSPPLLAAWESFHQDPLSGFARKRCHARMLQGGTSV